MPIDILPILNDNYTYIVHEDGKAAVFDPGEPVPVIQHLHDNDLSLETIFLTHHHGDHIGGANELKQQYNAKIIAPAAEESRIPGIDIPVTDKTACECAGHSVTVIETPGHTSGHVSFYIPGINALFCGDTLFSMGCGRLFEGTADQMWDSLQKLAALPDDTDIYCGHEYTLDNGRFCLTIEPDNDDLQNRVKEVMQLRQAGHPTIPSTLGLEKQTNAFLRAGSAARFAEIRTLKDNS